jgi:Squalene-hopene cyclase C-terminal domain/Prenyltransferase and squalene oxidase repeat
VSWQLAAFAIVLAALGCACWWYERSRPPAKLIAVVATLAALAALGRDAFAAIPDVKPITAIVLVSGVAFGASPGFAVGAVAGLASNVLLGEGPWTPWQMLGWGLVGLLGGALGRLAGRQPSAVLLALGCAAAAEAFNLLLDLYTWTGTGDHTLAGFGLVLSTALAFDLTHVIASFLFALAFGAALLRMLLRVRGRLQVSWQPAATGAPPEQEPAGSSRAGAAARAALGGPLAIVLVALCLPVLVLGFSACAGATQADGTSRSSTGTARAASVAIGRELSYLAAAQNADGGFGASPGQASSELYSAWAAIGMAAAGRDPMSVSRSGHTVLDALRAQASSLQGAGDLERTILALRACGAPVRSLPGGDPVVRLLRFRSSDGSFGHLGNLTSFAILALRAAGYRSGSATIASAARWLARQQERDGGYGFGVRGGGSDIDDTAAAIQALAAAGSRWRAVLGRGAGYLLHAQNLDGGFPQQRGGTSNAQSTAWAVQGLIASGHGVNGVRRQGSPGPVGYLQTLLSADGSVRYSRTGAQTPVWVTAQALTAFAGRPLPISPPR